MQDVVLFIGLALLASFAVFLVMLSVIIPQQLGLYTIGLNLLSVVINGAMPYLVALLVVRKIAFLLRLRHHQVFVSDASRMTKAASLDVVMFDKTGTLTVDQVMFQLSSIPNFCSVSSCWFQYVGCPVQQAFHLQHCNNVGASLRPSCLQVQACMVTSWM